MRSFAQQEESLQKQAEEIVGFLDHQEIINWQKHPCTQFILKRLEAETLGYHINWANGAFTDESESGTIQLNAKAIGAIEALELIADNIESLDRFKVELEEESEEDV